MLWSYGSWIYNYLVPMQSVAITTDVVSLNPNQREGVQHYVIKFVSDLWQVGGFLLGPPVSSTN